MKVYQRIFMVVIFGTLALFGICAIVMPGKEYSENENRFLEQYPDLSVTDVFSGEFEDQFETAFSDQFLGRDIWMMGATAVERVMGFQELNGVYFGKDGYLLAKTVQEDIDQKQYLKNLRYVEYFGECQPDKVSLLLAPSPGTILRNKLPYGAPYYNATAMYREADAILKRAKNINSCPELKEYAKQNQVYYKTDHHWTLLGAYAAYSAYSDANQFEKHTYGYFAANKISEDFLGTMYSKVVAPGIKPETMFAAGNVPPAQVVCDGEVKSGIYDVEKLLQKDKYGYFFGGNYGEVKITMHNENTRKLLVIKDSYANSFVPFLMGDYHEITMLDLRYYRNSIQKLLKENDYAQILVLYEMSNFAGDKNLYKLVH